MKVYIDVDGVLLPFREPVLGMRGGWRDWVDYRDGGQVYSPRMVESLNKVAAAPWIDMLWLTTWGERAPRELAPAIGLNGQDWPVVGADHQYGRRAQHFDWWKLSAMVDEPPEPSVWLDDDIHDDEDARDWLHVRPRVRWLSPECWTGLTPTHLRMLIAWTLAPAGPTPTPPHGDAEESK